MVFIASGFSSMRLCPDLMTVYVCHIIWVTQGIGIIKIHRVQKLLLLINLPQIQKEVLSFVITETK